MEENNIKNVAASTDVSAVGTSPAAKFKISKLPAIPVIIGVIVILAIIFGVMYFLFFNNNKQKTVESLTTKAQQDIRKGDYEAAQKKLKEALKVDKNDPIALSQMINSYSLAGNQDGKEGAAFKKSEPYISTAISTNPNSEEVQLAAGYAYETDSKYEKAREYYLKAEKVNSKSSDVYFRLGHVSEFLGKSSEAQTYYDKAYSIDPNNPQVLMVRGNSFFSEGDLQRAYDSFKKASENPDLSYQSKAEALTGASIARANQDNFKYIEEAVALSKEAVAADPHFSPALGAYGYNLYLSGMQKTGFDYVVKATEANPRISKNYFLLSMIYRTAKDYRYAIAAGKEAVSHIDDDNTILSEDAKKNQKALYLLELAKTYSVAGLPQESLPLLTQAVALKPTLAEEIKNSTEEGGVFSVLASSPEFQAIITQ